MRPVWNSSLCMCVRESPDLPSAKTLEEEVERETPHHGREQNTHQRQTLDSLTAPQLNTRTKYSVLITQNHLLIIYTIIDTTIQQRKTTRTFIMM